MEDPRRKDSAHRLNLRSKKWFWIAGTLALVTLVLSVSMYMISSGETSQTPTEAASTACPQTRTLTACGTEGTVSGLGTPIALSGLTVDLHATDDHAGPQTLTVGVTQPDGTPVGGAHMIITARSLDMDMGEFPHEAKETVPGRYVAERVGMGMGGDWQVEVTIDIPGRPPSVATFLVRLTGLM